MAASFFGAFVAVFSLVKDKAFALRFVLPEVGDIGIDFVFLAIAQTLAAAVARIGQDFVEFQIIFLKIG